MKLWLQNISYFINFNVKKNNIYQDMGKKKQAY